MEGGISTQLIWANVTNLVDFFTCCKSLLILNCRMLQQILIRQSFFIFKCCHSYCSTSFWPPSMTYISISNFYTLHHTIFQVLTDSRRPLWAAFMYCFKHLSNIGLGFNLDCSCSVVILESSYRPLYQPYIRAANYLFELINLTNSALSEIQTGDTLCPSPQADKLPIELSRPD